MRSTRLSTVCSKVRSTPSLQEWTLCKGRLHALAHALFVAVQYCRLALCARCTDWSDFYNSLIIVPYVSFEAYSTSTGRVGETSIILRKSTKGNQLRRLEQRLTEPSLAVSRVMCDGAHMCRGAVHASDGYARPRGAADCVY
jgi:hypothetical protein